MSKGLRFFGTDFNSRNFAGTITASSAVSLQAFAFDGLRATKWTSSGDNTDGDSITLERGFGTNRTIDSFYVYNTNIDDIVIAYWNGSAWVDLVDGGNATIVKDTDSDFVFAKLTTSVTTQNVRISGDNTIVSNQEKFVGMFFAFLQIGQFEFFPDFKPMVDVFQNVFKTTDARSFVIERGEAFKCEIAPKSHINQNDITLSTTLLERKEPFYLWANGGDNSIFSFQFKPFRFKDIFKMTIVGKNVPGFTKNYYKAGYNNKIKMIEVV